MNATLPIRKSKAEAQKNVMAILMGEEVSNNESAIENPHTLDVSRLIPFTNHPFQLYEGERLNDMVRSIKEFGILLPVIVRPFQEDDSKYEILSGHNRVNAAKIIGLSEVPVIIKKGLTDTDAELIVTETNLIQRSFTDLSHSQRALALKRHMDAISRQGKRNDLIDEIEKLVNPDEIKENGTSYLIDTKLRNNEKTGKQYGLSSASVARYVRIFFLSDSLKLRVDEEEIGLYPAVSLSYLTKDEQQDLDKVLQETAFHIDMKKAESLRAYSKSRNLSKEIIVQVLLGQLSKKPKSKAVPPLKIKAKVYQKYFNESCSKEKMEHIVEQALAEYFENHTLDEE